MTELIIALQLNFPFFPFAVLSVRGSVRRGFARSWSCRRVFFPEESTPLGYKVGVHAKRVEKNKNKDADNVS